MSFSDRFKKSSNPVLNEERLQKVSHQGVPPGRGGDEFAMDRDHGISTVQGAINKSYLMGALLLLTALYSFYSPSMTFVWAGAIGGLALVFAMCYRPQWSPTLAPIYALVEGLFVGSITAIYASGFGIGIVFQAVLLTIALLFMMLFVYQTGLIKVTKSFRTGIMMATGGILIVYLINIGLSFFGMNLPFLHQGGVIGIGISLFIIGIATLNLLLDFDSFEKIEELRAPQYMEWFCAMGLIVTIVWIYVEVLRLLSVLSSD